MSTRYEVLRRRLMGDTVIYSGVRALASAATFFVVVLLSRAMTPSDLGRYTLLMSAAGLITIVCFQWLGAAAYRFSPHYAERGQIAPMRDAVGRTYLLIGGLIAALALAIWFATRSIASPFSFETALFWVVYVATSGFASMTTDLFRVDGHRREFVVASTVVFLAPVAAMFLVGTFADLRLDWAVACMAVPAALVAAVVWPRWISSGSSAEKRREIVRKFASYGVPLASAGIASWFLSVSDRFLLATFENSANVAIYTVGYQLGSAPLLLLYSIVAQPLEPLVLNAHEGVGESKAGSLLGKGAAITLVLMSLATVVISTQAALVLDFFTGGGYGRSGRVVPFAAAGTTFLALGMVIQQVFALRSKTKMIFRNLAVAALVNVAFTAALVASYSYTGAAIATVIGYGTFLGLTAWSARGVYPLQVPWRWLTAAAVATAASLLAHRAVDDLVSAELWAFVVEVVVTTVAFVMTLLLLGGSSLIAFVRSLLTRRDAGPPSEQEPS